MWRLRIKENILKIIGKEVHEKIYETIHDNQNKYEDKTSQGDIGSSADESREQAGKLQWERKKK